MGKTLGGPSKANFL